ncbi:MAG TPA: TetR/AcrR family transcriptional regulator [Nocardioidaceae bacterium]|jgi:AcrR family transcriptional regulator
MSTVEQQAGKEPVRRGRGRPRDPETDKRIISAAADLILRRGFERMTVDEVAAQAGVGKATVYRRWPSKQDLAVKAMTELFTTEFPEPNTGSIRGDVTESIRRILRFVNTEEGQAFLRTTIAESIRDPRIAKLYRESSERSEEAGRRILQRGIERGEVRPDINVDLTMEWLSGLLSARVISGRPLPTLDELDSYVEWVLHGISVRPV